MSSLFRRWRNVRETRQYTDASSAVKTSQGAASGDAVTMKTLIVF